MTRAPSLAAELRAMVRQIDRDQLRWDQRMAEFLTLGESAAALATARFAYAHDTVAQEFRAIADRLDSLPKRAEQKA